MCKWIKIKVNVIHESEENHKQQKRKVIKYNLYTKIYVKTKHTRFEGNTIKREIIIVKRE